MPAVLTTIISYLGLVGQLIQMGNKYLPDIILDYQRIVALLEKVLGGGVLTDEEIAGAEAAWESVNKLAAASEDAAEADEAVVDPNYIPPTGPADHSGA